MTSIIEIQELSSNVCLIELKKKSSSEVSLYLFLETLKENPPI